MLKRCILGLLCLSLCSSVSAAGLSLPSLAVGLGAAPKIRPVQAVPQAAPFAVIFDSRTAGVLTEAELFDVLAEFDVIHVGEKHDEALHHKVQASVLAGLHARRPDLVVGLEMLDITQQDTLDAYLDGSMSESEFAEFWKKAWGFDFAIYRPILDYAKSNGVPVRALNAPRAVVSQVARGGLDSLTPEQRALIPANVVKSEDPRYVEFLRKSFEGHGPMPPEVLEKMMLAQAVWNETMGNSVARAAEGGRPVLVVAGTGHMIFGGGIPESVRRRAPLSQKVVLPYPQDGEQVPLRDLLRELRKPGSGDRSQGDFFWLLPGSIRPRKTVHLAH